LAAAERVVDSDAVDSDAEREQLRAYLRGTDPGDAVPDPTPAGGDSMDPPDFPLFGIDDATQVVAVLGIDPSGLELTTVEIDESGQARVISAGERRASWSELLLSLSGERLRQRFHLAGGIGKEPGVDPVKLGVELKGNLPALGLTGMTVLVAVSTTGWTLLDHLADRVRDRYAAEAVWRGVGIDGVLRQLARLRPIGQPYDLVMYDVLADGEVTLMSTPLFPAGAVPGELTVVRAHVPPGIDGPVVLPVVCRAGQHGESLPPHYWQPVSIRAADLPPGVVSMTARLDEPGQVSFIGVGEVTRDERPWLELFNVVPKRIPPTDLVLAVEYAGAEDAEARVAFARDALIALCERSPVADLIRVALVGYGQHAHRRHRREVDDLLRWAEFAPPAEAADEVGRWQVEPNRDDFAAAVEDALAAIATVQWREDAHRIVVFVASRPPYPTRQWGSDPAVPCPSRLDWRQYADELRAKEVRRIAVLQPPRFDQRHAHQSLGQRGEAWWVLGKDGTYSVDDTRPHDFVKKAGLLGDGAPPPPFVRPAFEPGDQADRLALEVTREF
jgi:hypothetical protein